MRVEVDLEAWAPSKNQDFQAFSGTGRSQFRFLMTTFPRFRVNIKRNFMKINEFLEF